VLDYIFATMKLESKDGAIEVDATIILNNSHFIT
jgi:hypothetical protein